MSTDTGAIQSAKQRLPRALVNLLRTCRHIAYLSLTPFDYLCRCLNGKSHLPPIYLRRHVGPLRTFEASGAEFMSYLRLLVSMQPSDSMLDIGCGCGLMALEIREYLDERGSYLGVDLHSPSIKWCRNHVSRDNQNFRFDHIDVRSLAYNPHGERTADSFVFPYDSSSFDVVLLKSVLTHMTPGAVENYLREVARLLRETGRCLVTLFLLNQEQQNLMADARSCLNFSFGGDEWRYVYENSPESASAYDER